MPSATSEGAGRATTAFVLAGGFGTRLRPVVQDRPKVLAPILGRPALAYILDQLVAAGVRRLVLGTGYLAEQVQAAFGDRFGAADVAYSRETEPLGTGGALRLAAPLLAGDPVLVVNGDSYCEADLGALVAFHGTRGAAATLLLTRVPDAARYGTVVAAPDGQVTGFLEKAEASGEATINAGVYVMRRSLVQGLPSRTPLSLERDVFPGLVGGGLYAWAGGGRFIDIGTPSSYGAAARFFGGLGGGAGRDGAVKF